MINAQIINIDGLLEKFNPKNKKPSKADLSEFVIKSLRQISEINTQYKKFFASDNNNKSFITVIEERLQEITNKYIELFENDPTAISKISVLENQLEAIRSYHNELLGNENSIKADIKEAQDRIKKFYIYLFGGNNGTVGQEAKIKIAIDSIISFNTEITKQGGYKSSIEDAHKEILKIYNDLYAESKGSPSKVSQLHQQISTIEAFNTKIEKELTPLFDEKQKIIKNIENDIETKQKNVNALLAGATGGSLVEKFLQSKKEYKQEPTYREFLKLANEKLVFKNIKILFQNILILFYNIGIFILNKLSVLGDYVLFIAPLILSVLIFIQPDTVALVMGKEKVINIVDYLGGLNVWGRLLISLPLWWISWFGQRNISHKKRLAEEYNHKAQVATMYLNFTANETGVSYPLLPEAKKKLDNILLDAIERHPGKVYGRDETMIDKIIQAIKALKGINDGLEKKIDKNVAV